VTGVSAGSINTACVALYAPGDEANMLQFMTDKWQEITEKDVYINWKPAGILTGLVRESGVFDDGPLHHFLTAIFEGFNYIIKRKFVVSCVDVDTGNYHIFNETIKDPARAILSSSSIPFIFPNQVWKDPEEIVCMDGGTVYNTNIVSAVQRCRETVDDDSEIIIDIVVCEGAHIDTWED
jgi:predicted acylesterase/phospholipase RssA